MGQELIQRPRRDADFLFEPYALLKLVSYRTQDHQLGDGTTIIGCALPHK